MKRSVLIAAILFGLAATGCGKKKHARAPLPPPAPVRVNPGAATTPAPRPPASAPPAAPATSELYGIASWYGHPYHGRRTSSGEVYDMNDMTAAHKTLALGTRVEVTNVENGKQVEVRINDRGPFVEGRIIDLSYAAAKVIEMVGRGTAWVRLQVLGEPEPLKYRVQAGAFRERANAERLQASLAARYSPVTIQEDDGMYRVLVGEGQTEERAKEIARRVRGVLVPAR
jgi:rare lipoprotein A